MSLYTASGRLCQMLAEDELILRLTAPALAIQFGRWRCQLTNSTDRRPDSQQIQLYGHIHGFFAFFWIRGLDISCRDEDHASADADDDACHNWESCDDLRSAGVRIASLHKIFGMLY
jgi:hypothetical protein